MKRMGMKVLLVGNVVDGVSIIGPFAQMDAAQAYAEQHFERSYQDWNIADLEAPGETFAAVVNHPKRKKG